MERAANLKALGYGWADITRLLRIPHRTLMNWAKDPMFETLLIDAKANEPNLERLARLVTVRQLEAGLKAQYSKEDAARVADRVLAPAGGDGEYAGAGFGPGSIVLLPMESKGLESKPMSQVLVPPSPPPAAAPAPAPAKKAGRKTQVRGRGKPRAAGPDE